MYDHERDCEKTIQKATLNENMFTSGFRCCVMLRHQTKYNCSSEKLYANTDFQE